MQRFGEAPECMGSGTWSQGHPSTLFPYKGLSFDTGLGWPSASVDLAWACGNSSDGQAPPRSMSPDTFGVFREIVWSLAPVIRGNRMNTMSWHYRLLVCYARCPNPPAGKEKTSTTMQHAKEGKFIADSSQGPCCNQRSGVKSESPEAQFPHTFIGCSISNISSG